MSRSISLPVEPVGRCFAPVVAETTKLLVLGSLPGVRSLAEARYYAHPQNQFWRLIGSVIGEHLAAMDYEARLAALLRHGVGLWDTVGEARRSGSLDSAIRDVAANDLVSLIDRLPALRLVAFNGQTAARIGHRALDGRTGVPTVILPSSSPAFTLSFDIKLDVWRRSLVPSLHIA